MELKGFLASQISSRRSRGIALLGLAMRHSVSMRETSFTSNAVLGVARPTMLPLRVAASSLEPSRVTQPKGKQVHFPSSLLLRGRTKLASDAAHARKSQVARAPCPFIPTLSHRTDLISNGSTPIPCSTLFVIDVKV